MRFEHLTVVNVDGRVGELLGTQYALIQSARQLPGARMLLLSPVRPSHLLHAIEHVCIAPLGYLEYSLFIVYALHEFIKTEFALIVQNDGWVLDGRRWKEEFFDYDYLGAPIHFARVTRQGRSTFMRKYEWLNHLDDAEAEIAFVMNGGFSLRSRRFLEAPARLGLPYTIPAITKLSGKRPRMEWDSESVMEDVHLCINLRYDMDQAGLRYAPLAVAKYFSFEHVDKQLHRGMNLGHIVGHHSRVRRLQSIDPLTVRFTFPQKMLGRVVGETAVVDIFKHHGYHVEFNPEVSGLANDP